MGIYQPHENGKFAWFNGLRLPNGTLMYLPENRELGIRQGVVSARVIPNARLKQGEWYQFYAQINTNFNESDKSVLFVSNQNFQPISNVVSERIQKEKFIKDLSIF